MASPALAITKLDVLDDLPELKICTGYAYEGRGNHGALSLQH